MTTQISLSSYKKSVKNHLLTNYGISDAKITYRSKDSALRVYVKTNCSINKITEDLKKMAGSETKIDNFNDYYHTTTNLVDHKNYPITYIFVNKVF